MLREHVPAADDLQKVHVVRAQEHSVAGRESVAGTGADRPAGAAGGTAAGAARQLGQRAVHRDFDRSLERVCTQFPSLLQIFSRKSND